MRQQPQYQTVAPDYSAQPPTALTKYEYKTPKVEETESREYDIVRDGQTPSFHVPVEYDERDKQMDKLKKAAYEDELKRMKNDDINGAQNYNPVEFHPPYQGI